jgi:hypothetical protein
MKYKFEITGTANHEQTWSTSGIVDTPSAVAFYNVPQMSMEASFRQLISGNATLGKPDGGCDGPYTITRMLIEKEA